MTPKRTVEQYKMIEKLGKESQTLNDIAEMSNHPSLTAVQAAELAQIEADFKRLFASMRQHVNTPNNKN